MWDFDRGLYAAQEGENAVFSGQGVQNERKWRMEELEEMALQQNPTIHASRQRVKVLEGRWIQEGVRPNPEIGWMADDMSSHSGAGKQGFTFSQEIVTGHKLEHAQNVVFQEIQVAKEDLESQKLKVITDVRRAVYRYLTLERKMRLYEELDKVTREAYRIAEALYKRGEVSLTDVLSLGVEAEKLSVLFITSKNDVSAAWRELACVLGNPEMPPVPLEVKLEMSPVENSWETFMETLAQTSPEIRAAAGKIQRAKRNYELEVAKNSSNVSVEGTVAYSTEEKVVEAGVGVSIPLRIRDRNQGNIASAGSEVKVAEKEYEQVLLQVQMRFVETYRNFENARKSVLQYQEKILPRATQVLEITKTGYQQGELGYLDVLSAQQQYMTTYIEYIDNLNNYWGSAALLEGKLLSGCLQ